MADIRQLDGWLNEPHVKDHVLAAARRVQQPFLLREVVAEAAIAIFPVQRVLSRAVKQGILTRSKIFISYPRYDKSMRAMQPGGRQRRVYLYRFAEAE